jgi:hypothetical protein
MRNRLVKAHHHCRQLIKCALNDHFVFRTPVPVVFFYRQAIPAELIIESLQKVLEDFPIFAGIIVKRAHQLYIDCNNQGVQINTMHSPLSLVQMLATNTGLDKSLLVDMINPYKTLKNGTPLLTIKLNYFSDGMAIGYCWHHSVGDMSTFMELLKALSATAQGKNYEPGVIVEEREQFLNEWIENKIPTPREEPSSGLKYLSILDIFHLIKQVFLPKKSIYLYFTEEELEALRASTSDKAGHKLSRNDVICAHLLDLLVRCRKDKSTTQSTTIVVNIRPRIGMLSKVLGNYLGAASLCLPKSNTIEIFAKSIHLSVKNFLTTSFDHNHTQEFVQKSGGLKKLGRIIPEAFLPQNKNLIISNWSNFGVYNIDFGISAPYLFLPIGKTLLPWVSCIVEGFDAKGLLVTAVLPFKVAKQLAHPSMQKLIHSHRRKSDLETPILQDLL